MNKPLRVLILEDSESDTQLVVRALEKAGLDVAFRRVDTAAAMAIELDTNKWDLVISDYSMDGFDAPTALKILQERQIDIPFIIVSGSIGEVVAVQMMKAGAHDYLMKDKLARLGAVVEREVRDATIRREIANAREVLRASEARYRRLFEAARDGILLIDAASGQIIDANPYFTELFLFPKERLLGRELWEIGLFKDTATSLTVSSALKLSGYIQYEYVQLQSSDGRSIDAELVSHAYWIDKDRIVQCNIRDIRRRVRAEKALKESEAKLKAAQEIGRIGSWEYDLESGAISWSEQTYRLFERDPSLGPPTADEEAAYYSKQQADALREYARRAEASGEVIQYELELRLPSGKIAIFSATMQPVCNASDIVFKLAGTVQDITERKRAEADLRAASAYNRSLIEASPDPMVTIGRDGRITDVNAATEHATGRSRLELIGTNFSNYFIDPERAETGYEQVFREGQVIDYPLVLQHLDGRTTPVLYNASVYRDETGGIAGVIAVARDFTRLIQANQALQLQLAGGQPCGGTPAGALGNTDAPPGAETQPES